MRKSLIKLEGTRCVFTGVFVRCGNNRSHKRWKEKTILLECIRDQKGEILTDHVWLNLTKGFSNLQLKKGDEVLFKARVEAYLRGYANFRYNIDDRQLDYKLAYPTKIVKVNKNENIDS